MLVLAIAVYAGVVLALKRRRRTHRHRAADPAVAVSGAWEEALDRLHEAAVVPQAAQTPLDLAAAVPAGTSPATTLPMRRLARRVRRGALRRRFGGPGRRRAAWESLDELERALDDGVSWSRRWRRRLDASTLRAPLTRRRRATARSARGWGDRRARWSSSTNALAIGVEVAHLRLDLVGEAVDRDEQRELAVRERVEDLAVVATRPHRVAVGHEPETG